MNGQVLPPGTLVQPLHPRPTAFVPESDTLSFQLLDFLVEDNPIRRDQDPLYLEVQAQRTKLAKSNQPLSLVYWSLACEKLGLGKVWKSDPRYAEVRALSQQLKQQDNERQTECVIHLFGVTASGLSTHLWVHGYRPYFVELGKTFDSDEIYLRMTLAELILRTELGDKVFDTGVVELCYEELTPFFGYQHGEKTGYLKIMTMNLALRQKACRAFRGSTPNGSYFLKTFGRERHAFAIHEFNLPPLLRFLHEKELRAVGWVQCPLSSIEWVQDESISSTALSGRVPVESIRPLENEGQLAPLLQLSFDIECHSEDGSFPVPTRPGNVVTQIGCVVQWFQPPPGHTAEYDRYIWVLSGCDPIPDAIVRACDTEHDLLQSFSDFVQQLDPDIMLGYNINAFDWNYLYTRAEVCGIQDNFSRLSRLGTKSFKLDKSERSSAAMSDNVLIVIPTPGRVQIDLYFVIKRDEQLASYKLDDVAYHFLKQNKHDVSPRQIWELQKGSSSDRRIVAEYCLQDCTLPLQLLVKLDVIIKKIGMAHVCNVPFSFIINRGQGIKLYSLVSQYCREHGFVLQDLNIVDEHESEHDHDAESSGYAGAIVLKPKTGVHLEPVTVNDFNSLYPSASISHNLCPTTLVSEDDLKFYADDPSVSIWTIQWRDLQSRDPDEWQELLNDPKFDFRTTGSRPTVDRSWYPAHWKVWQAPIEFESQSSSISQSRSSDVRAMLEASPLREFHFVQPVSGPTPDERTRPGRGIVPMILIQLLEARKKYKKLMDAESDAFKASVLNGLQLSYKVTANSLYGQMGASTSAIRCEPVASSITATGRMLLLLSRQTILREFPGSTIVYGDTDSLFVKYPVDRTLSDMEQRKVSIECGNRLEEIMGDVLVWPHKLAYEKVYDPFILLNKKKYTGQLYENDPKKIKKTDSKGLINKRRDNAPIVQRIYGQFVKSLLVDKSIDVAVELLRSNVLDLLEGKVALEELVISKTLKKEYKTPTPPAHKMLADRMLKRDPGSAPQVGDRVPFVFVQRPSGKGIGWSKQAQGDLVEHPSCLTESTPVDYLYYLEHQLRTPLLEILALFRSDPYEVLRDLETKFALKRAKQRTLDEYLKKP